MSAVLDEQLGDVGGARSADAAPLAALEVGDRDAVGRHEDVMRVQPPVRDASAVDAGELAPRVVEHLRR